jgi:hypothetical protein
MLKQHNSSLTLTVSDTVTALYLEHIGIQPRIGKGALHTVVCLDNRQYVLEPGYEFCLR